MVVGTILGTITSIIAIGLSVKDALEVYEDIKDITKPRAYIQIDNFYNGTLAQVISYEAKGVTNNLPEIVAPGYREAQVIQQNVPFQGVEMLASYGLPGNIRVFYYLRVDKLIAWRESNKLGISIRHTEDGDIPDSDWFDRVAENSTFLGKTAFKRSSKMLQCCLGDICIQGSMTSTFKANVTIRILPRKIKDLATDEMKKTVYGRQADLDLILNNPESCYISSRAASDKLINSITFVLSVFILQMF